MAGAVSAGAYTAGVLDILFRALEEHHQRLGQPDGPNHKVVIKAMSGASAGSICAGLAVAGLAGTARVVEDEARLAAPQTGTYPAADGSTATYTFRQERLHRAWVELLDIWQPRSHSGLLSTQDLDRTGREARSLLNGEEVMKAADAVLDDLKWTATKPYPFLSEELEVFFTVTDIAGVPYKVTFGGGSGGRSHRMAQHGVAFHFRVHGLGNDTRQSDWLKMWNDTGIPLHSVDTPLFEDEEWKRFKLTAVASGAFPLGLSSQWIASRADELGWRDEAETRGGAMPIDIEHRDLAMPDFGPDTAADTPVLFTAVDGGMVNNEPFEYARFSLRRALSQKEKQKVEQAIESLQGQTDTVIDLEAPRLARNPRGADKADCAVLMIDPFPEGPEYTRLTEDDEVKSGTLMAVLKALLPAMKNQARFKPSELINAADPDVRSRFLIQPARRRPGSQTPEDNIDGGKAIACGAFGGFSGFLDEQFRRHDFVLGQRNAQKFLRDHFKLRADNRILGLNGSADEEANIIVAPLVLNEAIPLPAWPVLSIGRTEAIAAQARKRVSRLGGALLKKIEMNGLVRAGLVRAWNADQAIDGLGAKVYRKLAGMILGGLVERRQHAVCDGCSDAELAVLKVLIEKGDEPMSAAEVDRKLDGLLDKNAPRPNVRALLDRLYDRGLLWRGWKLWGEHRYGFRVLQPRPVVRMFQKPG